MTTILVPLNSKRHWNAHFAAADCGPRHGYLRTLCSSRVQVRLWRPEVHPTPVEALTAMRSYSACRRCLAFVARTGQLEQAIAAVERAAELLNGDVVVGLKIAAHRLRGLVR